MKSYIHAVCECSGVITTPITIAVATAIVRKEDWNLLVENGGPTMLTKNWAKSLFIVSNLSREEEVLQLRLW